MLLKIRLTFAGNWHYNETMIEELTIEETKIEEEESSILSKAIVTAKSYDWVEEESLAIILRRPLANLQLCGKSQLDWVKLACGKMQKVVLDEVKEEDFLQVLRPYAESKKYIIVLYSDTPLLEKQTIAEALDYFASKNLNAMVLPRGYVFAADYLLSTDVIFSPVRKSFAPEQFVCVSTPDQINQAFEVLSQRIRNYHKSNGVVLLGEASIYIDADVEIGPGVIIEPFNVLKGNTLIEEQCHLKSGNVIIDTIVKKGSIVAGKRLVGGKEE